MTLFVFCSKLNTIVRAGMNRIIRADLYRQGGLTGLTGFIKAWYYPGFRYTYLFRMASRHSKRSLCGLYYRLLMRHYRFRYGFEINPEALIGPGFYLTSHCSPVIIGPVEIGRNCNVGHSVTIGRSIAGSKKGRPTIGNNVWIGTGSVVVGKINIGDNVLIAPNAFINFDVPDHSLVIGNPGKIIKKEYPTREYINNVIGE